jgi:integrase
VLVVGDHPIELPAPGDLDRFRELDEGVADLLDASRAEGTRRVYAWHWQRFEQWCHQTRQSADLPVDPLVAARYLSELVRRRASVSIVQQAAAAIADRHTDRGLLAPTEHPQVKRALQGARRTLGVRPQRQATPLSPADLRERILPLVPPGVAGLRDLVVLSFGLASALRRSELAALQMHQLDRVENGFVVRLGRSKADQEGQGHARGIAYGDHEEVCPVRLLDRWIASVPDTGPVLRGVRNGVPLRTGIGAERINQIVQDYTRRAGLRGRYSAHSLRSGYGTAAARAGKTQLEIQRHLGHRDPKSTACYIRDVEVEMSTATKGIGL